MADKDFELIDPYASLNFGVKEEKEETKQMPKENEDDDTFSIHTNLTAQDIYHAINSTKTNIHKVTIVSTLTLVDPNDPEHSENLLENTVGEAYVNMQRRQDTIQVKFRFPTITDEVNEFWNILEEYGKKSEDAYETGKKLPLVLIYVIPMDNANIFMSIQDPWFWSLQSEKPGGQMDQIRLFVPMQAVEFGANNIDQDEMEKELVSDIEKETNRLVQENMILEKEIEKIETTTLAEEKMDNFDDVENKGSDEGDDM